MNCKTCKHFSPSDPSDPTYTWNTSGFGFCSRIASRATLRKDREIDSDGCCVVTGYRTPDDEVFDDPVMTIDGSDYFSALKVKEDFGCVLWEEK